MAYKWKEVCVIYNVKFILIALHFKIINLLFADSIDL